MIRAAAIVLAAASLAAAQAPKVEKQGDWDIVTLPSGGVAKVLVPKTAPEEKRGLVMVFHGLGGSPDDMLRWGARLAEHRGDVWCAFRASGAEDGRRAWNFRKDPGEASAMLKHVVDAYKVDRGRILGFGFSMGGEMTIATVPLDRTLYRGFVTCASTKVPGEPGTDVAGMRAVVVIGTKDGNFAAMDGWRKAIASAGDGVSTWIVTDLDHELPSSVYVNDAFNFCFDALQKAAEKTLPLQPDHDYAPVASASAPEFFHACFAWKSPKSPPGVTRTKMAAKALADQWAGRIRKGEKAIGDASAESDDAATKERGGATDLEKLAAYSPKLADRAKALKAGAVDIVETEAGYHVLTRAAAK